jgi:hypothetical protein
VGPVNGSPDPQAAPAPGRPQLLVLPLGPQNLESTRLLVPELVARGVAVRVLLMDGLFHDGLDVASVPAPATAEALPTRLETPFYRLGAVGQVRALLRVRGDVIKAVGRPDAILAFNDGAVQRVAFRAAPRARSALLLDGIVSTYAPPRGPAGRTRAAIASVGRRLRGTPFGPFLPSDIGLSPVDLVMVVGEHSAAALRQRGAMARAIDATGLPRWPEQSTEPGPDRVRRVLYLTGAFDWHARQESAVAQRHDVERLAAACAELGLELVVRVHPRDDRTAWAATGVRVSDEPSMHADIAAADLVLSMVSTGLLEAIALRRIARPLILADDPAAYALAFVSDPAFGRIGTEDELRATLARYRDAIPPEDYEGQRAALAGYVAAGGAEAARRAAGAIASLLGR